VPAPLESPAGTAPSVLLIEEYDALAAAITSALKKFAPGHRTRVVESIGEAESAAAETQPQLFIVDFDPPHANAIEFLNRMSTAHPDARVLAIASGTSPALASERYGKNAIQFIEKPFELADFGAAVQALLGPWTEARSGDSRGTLRDLNLRDLIPLEAVSGATAVLRIEAEEKRAGEVHFVDGQICHAIASGLYGIGALHEVMRWKNARGKEAERDVDSPRTIQGPWQHNFLEALRATKPSAEELKTPMPSPAPLPSPLPSPGDAKQAKAPARTGKKIVVIDDTEMLLIFVEDVLSTADPSLQIVTAFTGGEGARRAEVMIPDLVLLDYSLPDLRGDQICERLLRNEATARIPVVMMSGHVPEMTATAERYSNVVATIAKPFMSDALVALVMETLEKGPLPVTPPKDKAPIQAREEPATVTAEESKPARHGNGKRPVKKIPVTKAEPQAVLRAPIAPPPPPAIEVKEAPALARPGPAVPTPAHLKTKEPTAVTETQPVSYGSVARAVRPIEPALFEPPPVPVRPSPAAKVATSNGSAVVLGLGMEVISVQFTPRLQIGTIRAKPSAATLSLTQLLTASGAENLWGHGFELGMVELDPRGQIRTMRVVPTRRPADSIRTHNGFDINEVELVNENACIRLIAGTAAPMTMQLLAIFKVAAVELSDRFEVAQLVLQPEGNRVRVTLDPQSRSTAGTEFETVRVNLDSYARIAEFVLNSTAA
jgi:DNA-binding response OmpR family regulator